MDATSWRSRAGTLRRCPMTFGTSGVFMKRITDLLSAHTAPANGASQVTQTVRAGIECSDETGCVIPPLHLSSTFAFRAFGEKRAYDYTRSGNPTRDLLAAALAELEQVCGAVVTASGMAAITLTG